MHELDVFGALNPDTLKEEEKHKALRATSITKDNRLGEIKGHNCAESSSQRPYISLEEKTVPMISLQLFFVSLIIDPCEKRAVQLLTYQDHV